MIPNSGNLAGLFTGYKTNFNKGFAQAKSHYLDVSMKVPSTGEKEIHGWLGSMPEIREWIGDRVVNSLSKHSYAILNKEFEMTVSVKRTKIEDDAYGMYSPMFEKMGHSTALHPDKLIFGLMKEGFSKHSYDGQNFFDLDHPVGNEPKTTSVSNMQEGDKTPWFLFDCSQPIKPFVYQERLPFDFTSLTDTTDDNVFFKGDYIYGVRGRSNAGFGLWQLAYASKAELTPANYEAARIAMQEFKSDAGEPLGILPTHLVVPPALEGKGRRLLKATQENGATNEWSGSAELIVSRYL